MRAITTNALERSLDIAATLEVRGYGTARRPARRRRPLSRHDAALLVSSAAIVAVTFAVPVHFTFYPQIHGATGARAALLAGALALAALAPFAQRRGIVR